MADGHAEAPRRIVGSERLAEHAAETGVEGAGDDARKGAGAQQLRAAEAAAAIRRLEPHVRQPLVREILDVGLGVADGVARAGDVGAIRHRLRDQRFDVGQRHPRRPARRSVSSRTCQNDVSAGSMISRRSRSSPSSAAARARIRFSRRSATSASTCTRSIGGVWPSRTRTRILRRQLLGQLQRPLLHGDVRAQRLQGPVGLLHRRDRADDGFAELQLGARFVPLRDQVLLPRHVDLPIADQRLRERDLEPGLQAGIEAVQRAVAGRPRRVPRDAPRAVAPRHALAHAGRREPVARVDAAAAEQRVGRRRHVARSRRTSTRTPACTRCGSGRPAPPELRCRAERPRDPDCGRRRAGPPRRASAPAPVPVPAAGVRWRRPSGRGAARGQREHQRRRADVVVFITMPPPMREP